MIGATSGAAGLARLATGRSSSRSPACGCAETWHLEVAALSSQLGYIALPDDLCSRLAHGELLSTAERELVDRMPATTPRRPVREVAISTQSVGLVLVGRRARSSSRADTRSVRRSSHASRTSNRGRSTHDDPGARDRRRRRVLAPAGFDASRPACRSPSRSSTSRCRAGPATRPSALRATDPELHIVVSNGADMSMLDRDKAMDDLLRFVDGDRVRVDRARAGVRRGHRAGDEGAVASWPARAVDADLNRALEISGNSSRSIAGSARSHRCAATSARSAR